MEFFKEFILFLNNSGYSGVSSRIWKNFVDAIQKAVSSNTPLMFSQIVDIVIMDKGRSREETHKRKRDDEDEEQERKKSKRNILNKINYFYDQNP